MHHQLLLILGLLFVVFLLVMLANKIKVAYPIFLVIAGLGISFIPGIPTIDLDPDIVFMLFLPPLLYEAAWYTSWNDFWKWKRPIALLAFGLVFLTSVVVAYAANSMIPGFTLALGFLLGGIISPPDAVAASTVMKGLPIPKRIATILEGESLVNDASSLIVFRFALAAVISGSFSLQEATQEFFLVAGMGIVIGLIGGNIMYAVHKFLPTNPAIDAALTVMTPYILFLAAEQFHYSGIMAVVTGGLFISWRSHEIFKTGDTRLNMLGVWTTLIFVLNTLVFILIGLQLPTIIKGLGEYSIMDGILYGVYISAIIIVLRILWIYPTAYVPRFLSKKIRDKDPSPGWKIPFIIGWSGMRGVVSLATALSIPLMMDEKTAFPQRNLILFITFVVIFITLVFQGITLPFIIKLLKVEEVDNFVSEEEQQTGIQLHLDEIAQKYIGKYHNNDIKENELIGFYFQQIQQNIRINHNRLESLECDETEREEIQYYHEVLIKIYAEQRKALFLLRKNKKYSDEEIRKAEIQLDLNDLMINQK